MLRLSAVLLSVVMLGNNSMSFPLQSEAGESSPMQVAQVPAFAVIGPFIRTTNAVEMSGQGGKIGLLWGLFMHGGAQAVPGVIDKETIYAVYSDYESNETGAYDLTLGKSVAPEQKPPESMRLIHLPAAQYLVFAVASGSPGDIKAAWMNVYCYFAHHPDQRRAFTYDFEQYSSTGTRIFVAIH